MFFRAQFLGYFFLIYKNDPQQKQNVLDPIVFATGDTILFYSHQDTNTFFSSLNVEQEKFNNSLITNKLSLILRKLSTIYLIKVLLKMTCH